MTYDVIARARRSTRRRVTAACLAAAAVTAVVAAVVVSVAGPHRPTAVPVEASATSAGPVLGGSPAGDQVLPADLTWTVVAGMSLPVSSQSGPRDTSGGLARGFAHADTGAVLAAAHILVRISPQVGPEVFDPTLRTQVVGPDAATLRTRVAEQYQTLRGAAGVADGQPVGRLYATLRGYQLDPTGADATTVRLLVETSDGVSPAVLAVSELHMQWTGTDWALIAPPGGDFAGSVSAVTSDATTGFLPFTRGR